MRQQFKNTILSIAQEDPSLVLLFGDVSVYLFREFAEKYPERFYNVGICENTIVSLCAGLSLQGLTPVAHTIAPFLVERSYEQIKIDLSYNSFPANIVTCGASFDYAWDGATHHCYNDLELLRVLPNFEIMQPGSKKELDILFRERYQSRASSYFKLSDHPHSLDLDIEFGKGLVLKNQNAKLTVATAGPILGNVLEAVADLPVNLLYFHTIKPIDSDIIMEFAGTRFLVIHDSRGLFEAITSLGNIQAEYYGLPDEFVSTYGTLKEVRETLGLNIDGIRERITKAIS